MKTFRCFVAFALMAGPVISKPACAFVDPVTAGMAISLVSQGLSFGAKPDPQGKEISAILAHVRAIDQRLTHLEDQNSETQAMILQLPQQWRDDLKSLLDTIRKEDMQAISEVLKEFADSLTYLKPGPSKQRAQMEGRIEQAIVHFKEKSRALEQRSGAVAPFMIAAMVQEITIERQQKMPRQTISGILQFYDGYFSRMQDKSDGSLAGLRAKFEADRVSDRQALADHLSKKKDMPLSGEYLFYAATQTKSESKPQVHLRSRCGHGRNLDAPCEEEGVDEPKVIEEVPVKTVRHAWKVGFAPFKDHPDLGTLQVSEVTTEEKGTPSTERAHDLGGIDKAHDQERSVVRERVRIFNLRDRLIASIRDQETAVAMARTLIANWDNGMTEALARRAEALRTGDLSAMKTEMNELRSSLQLSEDRAKWDEERRKILAPVQEAENNLQEAIKEAARDKWRREIMHGLAYAQFGLSTYQFVAMHLPKDKGEMAPKEEQPSVGQKQKSKPVPSNSKKPVPDPRIGATSDHRAPEEKFTVAARTNLEIAKTMPAEQWKRLPEDSPALPEALIHEGLADLDRADQVALIRKNQKPGSDPPTDAELWGKGIDFALNGEYHKALALALASSAGGNADFDDPGGFRDRNTVRGELLKLEANFAAKRAAQAREDHNQKVRP